MKKVFLPLLFILFLFSGCGDNSSSTVNKQANAAGAYIVFDSTNSNIPYPNNILFSGSTDGTLNIPYNATDADAAVKAALNTLDGFSTSSPISVSFSGEINASTLMGNIHVYDVNGVASSASGGVPIVMGINRELTYGVEYVATVSGGKIVILPIKPLDSNKNYVVVLTNGIKGNDGNPIAPDVASELLLSTTALIDTTGNHTSLSDSDATTFEGIRQATQYIIISTLAFDTSLTRDKIVSAWSFKTQTIGAVAQAFSDHDANGTMQLQDTGYTSKQMIAATGADVSSMHGNAEVYAGILANIPYYLAKASSQYDTAPLTKSFHFSSGNLPDVNSTISIPVLATVPTTTMPANGWPVVIFQHGITQNRTNVLAISETFARAGYAAVAIDLPLHGIDDNTSSLYMKGFERTFDLDLVNNTTNASGPDGVIDASGTHFINLLSLLTSRDNVRQTTSDLIALTNSLKSAVEAKGLKFDTSKVAFMGHSLGAIASFGFLAHANLESVTLAMPGGGIAELLNNSARFGPVIEAGLASNGVVKGTSDYAAFMLATQTVVDDGDPINYAMSVGVKQKVFAIEVVGGNGVLSDQVIPNKVATAPLSGTDPLVAYMQATTLSGNSGDLVAPNKTARYIVGDHASVLDPTSSLSATAAMQSQIANFIAVQGATIPVADAALLNTSY